MRSPVENAQAMRQRKPLIYLAGPSIFFDDWRARAAVMRDACAALGAEGLYPADYDVAPADDPFEHGVHIFLKDRDLIERADGVVADLTPFRGISADVGTVWEAGYACGRGKPVAAFSLDRRHLRERVAAGVAGRVEDFTMGDNLMLAGANVTGNPEHSAELARTGGVFTSFETALASVLARIEGASPSGRTEDGG
jgi:nucleoside 2-deoxyribosyltransferase